MQKTGVLDKILEQFIENCQQRNVDIDRYFAKHYLNLLVQDSRDGLDLEKLTDCKIKRFLECMLQKYQNPLDATVCNLKLCYFYKNCRELKLDNVKEKYDLEFKTKLKRLINDILQYPETCNNKQIEKMCEKMQVFIITYYSLGCPKNHVLLKQTKQSLNSVLGRGDLQNYVLKKKYHRLEYLQRLSATVCGILVYNNMSPDGDKEHMRDIKVELEMAQTNTKSAIDGLLKKTIVCKSYGSELFENLIKFDVKQEKVYCYWPIDKVNEVNKFIVLYTIYERFLKTMLETFEKTVYLISVGLEKLQCAINKINDVLKYRTAIQSELIFPHFVYLSEVWLSLVLYFNHLVELNKIRDTMESYVSEAVESCYIETVELIKQKSKKFKIHKELSFNELKQRIKKTKQEPDLLKIKTCTADFCTLTIALTNGLVVPANFNKSLCENLSVNFGFRNFELTKYAELHLSEYFKAFKDVVYTSIDLILLFDLEHEIHSFETEADICKEDLRKTMEYETQTEMVVVNDFSVPNKINFTWNKWDYHRETIRLANIRRRQTHSMQTAQSFGQRNAQNQAYNSRRHV